MWYLCQTGTQGDGELDIWCRFFLAEVCFLWGQSTIYLFCFLSWKHMLILWCPKSLSISFDLFIQIWLNIYIWPQWHGKAFIFLSRLNHYICYQLSHGKTVMENKHVLIHLVCKVSTYTSERCWSMNEWDSFRTLNHNYFTFHTKFGCGWMKSTSIDLCFALVKETICREPNIAMEDLRSCQKIQNLFPFKHDTLSFSCGSC